MNRPVSDAIVFFGATGELAYEQIFPALHVDIAEQTGELDKGFGVEATMAGETVLGARLQPVERPSSLGNADDR
jgi:glucose-6-phosphate 1-dehydrogenase